MATYKSAQVYTGSGWVNLAVNVADVWERIIANVSSTAYTLPLTDAGKAIVTTSELATTITIPAETTANFTLGESFVIIQKGTGQVTIAAASGVTLNSLNSYKKSLGQFSELRLFKTGSNEWFLSGNLTA